MWQLLGGADNFTATILALIVLAELLRGVLRRTLFRRRSLRVQLNQLAIGVSEAYILSIFGAPTYGAIVDGSGWLAWALDYVNLSVFFHSDRVDAFTVTLIDPDYRFDMGSLTLGYFPAALGQSTFAETGGQPSGQTLSLGARRVSYSESHYYGNPGGYLTYILGFSDSSPAGDLPMPRDGAPASAMATGEFAELVADPTETNPTSAQQRVLDELHAKGRPNTVSVMGPGGDLEATAGWSGAIDLDTYRLLPRRADRWRRLEARTVRMMRWVQAHSLVAR